MNLMLKSHADMEGVTALSADHFTIRFSLNPSPIEAVFTINRTDAETLRALLAEAMRSTQDSVSDPEKLARAVVR